MRKVMSTQKNFMTKIHFNKMFLSGFIYRILTWFVCSLWGFLRWFVFKIFFFLEKYIDRVVDGDDFNSDFSQKFLESDEILERKDFDEKGVKTESSVFMESKYEYISGKDSFGFMEKLPEAKSFLVQEMFVNFNEGEGERVVMDEDLKLDYIRNEEEKEEERCDHKLFHFSFFNDGNGHQEHVCERETRGEKAKLEFFYDKEANHQEESNVFDEKKANGHERREVFDGKVANCQEKTEVFDEKDANGQEKTEIFNGKDANGQEKIEIFDEKEAINQEKAKVFDGKGANGQEKIEVFDEKDEFNLEKTEVFDEKDAFDQEKTEVFDEKGVIGREKTEVLDEKEVIGREKTEVFNEKDANSREKIEVFDEKDAFDQEKTNIFDGKDANSQAKTEVFDEKEANGQEKTEVFDEKEAFDQEKTEEHVENLYCEEILKKKDEVFSDEEAQNSEDICYEIQLLPENPSLFRNSIQGSDEHLNYEMGFIELETSSIDRVEETHVNFQEHNSSRKSRDTDTDTDTDDDSDEDECNDILLEHQNLVKQMKMEMRNSRIAGLPTISEDCESPKVFEDLKPLKIDEKIEYKDCMEEIQKFYKSYAEKMRKLDILNYQTLNAISFLQLKDSEVFMSSKKSTISITKAFTLPNFLANKQRKIFADPALNKSISEMNRDLEIVYVGQICLSWEILCWQYGKSKELFVHDPHEYHTYNQVAGEYQQFQVLLQRFIEDEPFQGPRVQNYVRKRCTLRSFLQVPSIRDDRSKEKPGGREEDNNVISIVKLAEIIKETMQVFWEFLRADKREANLALKDVLGTQMDTAEIELFMNVKLDLQKKERKLKDVQRSGNCIVKKFQKQHEGRLSHSVFASIVELKLVSRVLNLQRLRRDYLIWCQRKISNINVAGRKVNMEQSFSLFPC